MRTNIQLPTAISERLRPIADRSPNPGGRLVVYWMHHAVRGHDNPALDAAILAATALDLPLLVYQGLGGRHRYNSDRHHTFMLEGARDVRIELTARGLSHSFWLGEDPAQPSPLRTLAADAALVVTEDFPAPPLPRWTQRLAERTVAPVWAVDTACVVPMQLVGRPFGRAYRFRDAIRRELGSRLHEPWRIIDELPRPFDPSLLPFADTDLTETPIAELVASCDIDHTVGPVHHTRGGSVAGYARWQAFRDSALRGYARRRNDANAGGVSRLSAYLHHGHVSPLRIAREAAELGGKGAEKYLDELIIWRELAHNLCFHRHHIVESLEVLPSWARQTLDSHAADRRQVLSAETLSRGRTGDTLWDLAQASLVRHGELHNNARMTWGKALIGWSRDPAQALERLIDLNHRYALDGSDPNSYGGLLWCLGLFDRPFEPEQPILGSVRGRTTAAHARRLDLDRYAARVLPPSTHRPLEVAVIGAGLSGLACARTLHDQGHTVRVFEANEAPGGRTASWPLATWRFDSGAQYFTARDSRFRRWVESWRDDGVVAAWPGTTAVLEHGCVEIKPDTTERLVGVPGMSAICRHLAADLTVRYETRINTIERSAGRWLLRAADGRDLGRFDTVVVSAPAPLTAHLLEPVVPDLAARAAEVDIAPCWSMSICLARPLDVGFDRAFVNGSPLSWIARNSSKSGRPDGEAWVLHASPEWSREHATLSPDAATRRMLDAFREATGHQAQTAEPADARFWPHALPVNPLTERCLFDSDAGLAACGDWCGGPRVEGAFLSGCAAAGRLLGLRPAAEQPGLFGDE